MFGETNVTEMEKLSFKEKAIFYFASIVAIFYLIAMLTYFIR
jgi:hypothetical protein